MKRILTQQEFITKVNSKFGDLYNVVGPYTGVHNKVKLHCNQCGNEWDVNPKYLFSTRFVGCKCEQCGNRKSNEKFLVQLQDLNSQCMPLDDYIDQSTEIRFQCLKCGEIFYQTPKKFLNQLKTSEKPCQRCGDKISYPEKFFYSFLRELGCDFVYQYNKHNGGNWCNNFSYDFYIPEHNLIVETHGLQHYRQTSFGNLQDIQANDRNKLELAIENNVDYVVINCSRSRPSYIIDQIKKSKFNELYDLSNVKWEECSNYASKSIFDTVCDIYKSGNYTYAEIADIVPISPETVGVYIRSAIDVGILEKKNWRTDKHKKGVKIHCVELNMDFPSVRSANLYLNKKKTNCSIHSCLNGITKTAFGYHWYKLVA